MLLALPLLLAGCATNQSLAIFPAAAELRVGTTQQFSVSGLLNGGVVWSVNGIVGGSALVGTISDTGLYQAPEIPPSSGPVTVAVANAVDLRTTASAMVRVSNPTPVLDSISPTTAVGGVSDLLLTVKGRDFARQSVITIGTAAIPTSFVSSTELSAAVPSSLLVAPAVLSVAVATAQPGGGTTSPRPLHVERAGAVSATAHPLVASYSIETSRPARVTIEFGPDANYGLRTWSRKTPPGGGRVEVLVAGMRERSTYHMRARVEFSDGTLHRDINHTFTTGAIPTERVPPMTVTRLGSLNPVPGVQFMNLTLSAPAATALVTDLEGRVIWFYDDPDSFPVVVRLLENGNVLVVRRFVVREVDLAGRIVREISTEALNEALSVRGFERLARQFHHDGILLPNGNLLLLADYVKPFDNVQGFEGQTIDVVGDTLVEVNAQGEPVWTWSSFDHLDVNRHPMGFPDAAGNFDWTHGNAVAYSPADGNLLLSIRHLHWVLKIGYQDGFGSGEVLWKLGFEGDFTLLQGVTPQDWQYAQHFPFIVDTALNPSRIALFDNGNNRLLDSNGTACSPTTTPCFSRAVIFEIDEFQKTARLAWQDRLDIFAPFIGSAQVLSNGNVLYNAGTVGGQRRALIREVTQESVPQGVWQLDVTGQFVYRSLRLPSLYPGVQW